MHQKISIGNGERGVWWKASALIEEMHWLFHSRSYLTSVLVPLLFFWVKILNSLGFLLYFLFFFFFCFWQVRNCYKRKSFSKCISRALLKAGSSRLFSFCWLWVTHSLVICIMSLSLPVTLKRQFILTVLCTKNYLRQRGKIWK